MSVIPELQQKNLNITEKPPTTSTTHLQLQLRQMTNTIIIPNNNNNNNTSEMAVVSDIPKTPTTPNQRIPDIGSCPPAPRKPKSRPIRKRKVGGSSDGCTRLLDFSQELDSIIYPSFLQVNFGRNFKKARSF